MEEQGIDCLGREWIRIPNKRGKDWTDTHYEELTYLFRVKKKDRDDKKHSWWLARCNCGKLVCVRSDTIGKTVGSCGCLKIKKVKESLTDDLTGRRFGRLTVMHQTKNYKNVTVWHCKCDCGKECDVKRPALISGGTKSCGCLISWKEEEISHLLEKHSVIFQRQYRIQECRDKKPLPFDFGILDKENNLLGVIEYQGAQHYRPASWDNVESFQKRQKHDKMKFKFCSDNKIPLLVLNSENYNNKTIYNWIEQIKAGG